MKYELGSQMMTVNNTIFCNQLRNVRIGTKSYKQTGANLYKAL